MEKKPEDKFEALERTLETFIENARHLSVMVNDFQPGAQPVLNQKIQTLVNGLEDLDRDKAGFSEVRIPQELLHYVDTGRNPQLFTRQCLENTMETNTAANGKIELYTKFRAQLMKELSDEFPDEMMHYRLAREAKKEAESSGS